MKNNKSLKALKTIGEVALYLNLINKISGKLQTHTIRYWETQFKQIKPMIRAGKRRYYSSHDVKLLSHIKFLLKEKGLTIKGVKKLLNDNDKVRNSIDASASLGVYKPSFKETKVIKDKIKNLVKIVKEINKLKNG
jgi:DNA-binding transcriptional MerR regulator